MKEFSLDVASPHSPAAARSALLSPQTWERLGASSAAPAADGLTAVLPLRADQLPDALSRFVRGEAGLQVQVSGEAAGAEPLRLVLTVPGAPAEVRVRLDVRAGGEESGSVLSAQAQLESSVPFLGGMVESALEPVVRTQLAEQLHEVAHLA